MTKGHYRLLVGRVFGRRFATGCTLCCVLETLGNERYIFRRICQRCHIPLLRESKPRQREALASQRESVNISINESHFQALPSMFLFSIHHRGSSDFQASWEDVTISFHQDNFLPHLSCWLTRPHRGCCLFYFRIQFSLVNLQGRHILARVLGAVQSLKVHSITIHSLNCFSLLTLKI